MKLPRVSGQEVVKALERLGYRLVRVKGSHAKLVRPLPGGGKHVIVVPLHPELDKGTLRAILRMFSKHGNPEDLLNLLK